MNNEKEDNVMKYREFCGDKMVIVQQVSKNAINVLVV